MQLTTLNPLVIPYFLERSEPPDARGGGLNGGGNFDPLGKVSRAGVA